MNRTWIAFSGNTVIGATISSLFYDGIDLVFYAVTGILLLVAFGAAVRAAGERALTVGGAGAALVALVVWSALALVWTDIAYLTVLDIGHLGMALLAYAACRLLFVSTQARGWIAAALVAVGCGLGIWMIGQAGVALRPTGPFLNPNAAAAFLNMIWPVCAAAGVYKARSSGHFHVMMALTGFLLIAVFLDGSRAALLSAVAALLVFFVQSVCEAPSPWRRTLMLGSVFTVALVIVQGLNVLGAGGVTGLAGQMASLGNPGEAGSSRWPIWQGTVAMIAERPWFGFGPGTFFQVYPAWRPPGDGSAGNFAHNDYLQFWAERGLPGLVLLLLIGASCARGYLRGVSTHLPDAGRATVVAATATLAAAAVHALFSFNLHLLPFMCLCGIAIAALESESAGRPLLRLRLGRCLTRALPAIAFVGLLLLPATVWTAIAAADYRVDQAAANIRAGEFEAAGADFRAARRLWEVDDIAWALHADMLRALLGRLPEDRLDARRSIKEAALDLADGARQRNPWRALTPATRGRLHLHPPDRDPAKAEAALRHALSLDPRFTPARLALAGMLHELGDLPGARRVMEQGLEHYSRLAPPLRVMRRAVHLRRMTGDIDAADRLAARIDSLREEQRRQALRTDRRTRGTSLPGGE